MKAKELARCALLLALMLVLGYVESRLPAFSLVPGIKLGLANAVLLYALYLSGTKSVVLLAVMKVLLSGFLFGSPSAMLYSGAGALVSLGVMVPLKKSKKLSPVGVSVAGAVGHNLGQCAMAAAVIGPAPVAGYFPVLLLSGVVTGIATGSLAALLIKHTKH